MSKHLFILGAGASAEAGAPVMSNFLDTAQDLFWTNNVRNREAFKNVFENIGKLQSVHSKSQLDIVNLESVFNAFEMARLIDRLDELKGQQIDSLIRDLKIVIVETLDRSIIFNRGEGGIPAPGDYEQFGRTLREIKKQQTTVDYSFISFNYDICLDLALERHSLVYSYYLDDKKAGFPLLKLHGSLNWFGDQKGNIHSMLFSELFNHYHWGSNRILIESQKSFKEAIEKRDACILDPIPTIVPPAWNKSNHHENIKKVWKKAGEELASADHIHVIGFSMPATDAYFSLLFALGTVSEKPLRSFTVYNPEEEKGIIDEKFRRLLGPGALSRYSYYKAPFEFSIAHIEHLIRSSA